MDILRGNTVIATVHPTDDSVYSCKLMGDNAVKLNFKSSIAVSMLIGDTVVYDGATFTLNSQPIGKEVSTREYEYTCEFQAVDSELKKVEYRLFDNTPIPPQGEFSLMGTARTFVQLLVDNMNRIQSGWTLGQVLDTEFKSLDFSTENCLTVIQNIAKEFNTEFYITAPKVINLQQKPFTGAVIDLEYGINKGLKSLTKLKNDDSVLITSLHVLGGTRNLPLGYRDGSQRLMLPGGLPLQNNVDKFGVIEGTKVFDGIYPRLAAGAGNDPGKVTANAGLYQFTDTNLDFDVNQYLSDATAKVVFLTGKLAGYQFEIASYVHATKTFTINPATYENSIELPSADFHAAPGDKYVLIDIIMPQADIDRAEAELLAEATAYLPVCSNLTDNYTGDCDPLHFRRNNISIVIGQIVRIISAQLGINKEIRVIGINQNLNNPFIYKLDFGDIISGRLAALESDVAGIAKTSTSASKTLSQTDSLIVQLKNSSLRRYSDAKGVSKRINEFAKATTILGAHRLEVDVPGADMSEYIEAQELAAYIASKYKFSYNAVLNRFETSVDLYSAGSIISAGTIQFFGSGAGGGTGGGGASALWELTDVDDDMKNSLYGDLPMYNGTHFARYNISNFATVGHGHTIAQVTGLQGSLDGKQSLLGYTPYYSANFVAGVNYSAPHSHPYLSDSDARIANWSTAYGWGNHAGLYRPIGYVPSWGEITSKPTWTEKFGWDGVATVISSDVHITGKLVVDGTIQFFGSGATGGGGGGSTTLWGLSDVSDDVANAVYGDLIMYNGTHFARINQSVLAPAVHTHTIAQVTGLQGALDTKMAIHTHPYKADIWVPSWGEVTGKPTVLSAFTNDLGNYGGFALAHAHPYLSDSDARITNWNTAYTHSQSAHYTGADIYAWAKATVKPAYTKSEIGLSVVDNTADSSKSVAYAANSGLLNGVSNYSLTTHGHNYISGEYIGGGNESPNYFGGSKLKLNMLYVPSVGWADCLWLDGYGGGDVPVSNQLVFGKGYNYIGFRQQNFNASSWGVLNTIYHSGNFNPSLYLPLTGGTLTGPLVGTTATFGTTAGSSVNITTNNNAGTSANPLDLALNFKGYNGNLLGCIKSQDIAGSVQIGKLLFYTYHYGSNLAMTLDNLSNLSVNGAISANGQSILGNTGGQSFPTSTNQSLRVVRGDTDWGGYIADILSLESRSANGKVEGSGVAQAFYLQDQVANRAALVGRIGWKNTVGNNSAAKPQFFLQGGDNNTIGDLFTISFSGNGWLAGSFAVGGNITSNGTMQFYTASDRRLKTDFETITNPIEKIKSLTGYFFNYTDQAMALGGYTSRRDIGLIAQDVHFILPEATGKLWNSDFMGYKADKLIPLLVEAIKQQQNQIEELKRQIAA